MIQSVSKHFHSEVLLTIPVYEEGGSSELNKAYVPRSQRWIAIFKDIKSITKLSKTEYSFISALYVIALVI